MSDIVYESENDFKLVKVELGDDKEWKDRYMVNAFPDFGVFVNSTYYRYTGKKVPEFYVYDSFSRIISSFI